MLCRLLSFESQQLLVEIGDGLLQHRAMRGDACFLEVGERPCACQHQRCPRGFSRRLLGRHQRPFRTHRRGSVLLRLDRFTFPASGHLSVGS